VFVKSDEYFFYRNSPLTEVKPKAQNVNEYPTMKILIAEDNGTYRKLLAAMIERITGSTPEQAADGVEAVEMITREDYDLVFMDNHMPRMNGIEATRIIRSMPSARKYPYIVAVSGSSSPRDLDEFRQVGMNDLLGKPFGLTELQESIEQFLGQLSYAH
jgi:CheY-like chemotaxis protein